MSFSLSSLKKNKPQIKTDETDQKYRGSVSSVLSVATSRQLSTTKAYRTLSWSVFEFILNRWFH